VEAIFATDPDAPFELVIVDNASCDGTKEFLSTLPRKYNHISIKTLTEEIPGLGRARNTGSLASTGSIIASTDDDCYVTPDFIRAIQSSFENPLIGVVGGRILLYDPQDNDITTRTDESPEFYQPYTYIRLGALQGANLAFRRSALEAIGWFDNRFGAGAEFWMLSP
jgi:glycosyltransferase involved in cell wall biosynthesis